METMTTPDDYGYLDDDLETCDRNIAAIEAAPHDGPAWLPAMGQADFHAEKEMIKRESNQDLSHSEPRPDTANATGPDQETDTGPQALRRTDQAESAGAASGDRCQDSGGAEPTLQNLVDLYRDAHDYQAFLNSKRIITPPTGIEPGPVNDNLFPFQGDIVRWALRRGRAALYEDCGLGKTIQELSWGKQISDHTGRPVILLAPLAVSHQTLRESQKFDIEAHVTAGQVHRGINITNYEKLKHFNPADFSGIICDESSILKGLDGKLRKHITQFAKQIPYRLLASATPSPNDYMELGSQAEFLDIMSHQEMLATFFTHDMKDTQKWRLKGHAEQDYWKWLASWSVCLQNPADIGYPDDRFKLPPLVFHEHVIESKSTLGYLFPMEARTLQDRQRARKDSVGERVAKCAEIVNASDESWIVWCHLNAEGDALEKAIPNSVQVAGKDSDEQKERAIRWFLGEECICAPQKKTRRTCVNTMPPTSTDGKIEAVKSGSPTTQIAERNMPPMTNIESGKNSLPGPGNPTTQTRDSINECANTESRLTNTENSSPSRMGAVPFAETSGLVIGGDSGSMLTTAIQLEQSGDYSAPIAITVSVNSRMISPLFAAPKCTCGHISGRRVLVSKGTIFGFGMNLQACHNMAFVGLSDSYEQIYQAIRRCWRFGQTKTVNVHIITADTEGAVLRNIKRKEAQAQKMSAAMVEHMKDICAENIRGQQRERIGYFDSMKMEIPTWLSNK